MISPRENNVEGEAPSRLPPPSDSHRISPSISSQITITPRRLQQKPTPEKPTTPSPTRLAGIVGLFTGCGALLALGLFLRLPALIQRDGIEAGSALADSYYIVGALSLVIALFCFVGLRNLQGEAGKGWRALVFGGVKDPSSRTHQSLSSAKSLFEAIALGFRNPLLGLGYLGGFVARASSVGISLFIPLFVNAYYISSGRCKEIGRNPQNIKDHCGDAYVLAAELTGISQLVALLFAPVFGFLAGKYPRFNVPLLTAALVGILGYIGLANLDSPRSSGERGSPWIFVVMVLLGISQIGAIVCSLGKIGNFFLQEPSSRSLDDLHEHCAEDTIEATPLLGTREHSRDHLKGSIAGVYSLAGGAGILILTKVGGVMFDKVSPVAPFYMLAVFNGLLLVAGIAAGVLTAWGG